MTCCLISPLFLAGFLCTALAPDIYLLYTGRILGGFCGTFARLGRSLVEYTHTHMCLRVRMCVYIPAWWGVESIDMSVLMQTRITRR